jgi:hypothetical protein
LLHDIVCADIYSILGIAALPTRCDGPIPWSNTRCQGLINDLLEIATPGVSVRQTAFPKSGMFFSFFGEEWPWQAEPSFSEL